LSWLINRTLKHFKQGLPAPGFTGDNNKRCPGYYLGAP